MTSRLIIECGQLHSGFFGRRHSTPQLHGLCALANSLVIALSVRRVSRQDYWTVLDEF